LEKKSGKRSILEVFGAKMTKSLNHAEIGTWRRQELSMTPSLMDKEVDNYILDTRQNILEI
jgi:hypothetical protein